MRSIKLAFAGALTLFLAGCAQFDQLLGSIGEIGKPTNHKVAILLPLSGSLASVGGQMKNAMQLAQSDFGGGMEVQYFDTAGSPAGAQAAAAQAAAFGPGIVLGPLLGTNIASVRSGLGEEPALLAFSNDVTKAGGNNYIFGLTPANSAKRILQYAASIGRKSIGILYPDNDFGRAATAAANQLAPSLGITIVRSRKYSPAAGREGAASRQAAAESMGAVAGSINGLFIPDGGGRLREVASLAFFYRLEPGSEAYLGTQLMDDSPLGTEPALNGARFSSLGGSLSQFETRYAAAYGGTPRSISAVAYDAMALMASLKASGQSYSPASLTNSNGFKGVMGTYRINADGTTERLMSVKRLSPNGISVVESAGSSFVF